MTSWGDEDLRCFARVQCYPNSSAMLIRSIIKQKNPRLEGPAAEDWRNQCPMQEQLQTPPWIPQCLTGMTRGSHTHHPNTSTSTNVLYYQKYIFSGLFLCLLGELEHLAAGAWCQAMLYLCETQVWGRLVWLGLSGVFTLGWKLQARSHFAAHSWAPFCTFLLAKKKGKEVPKSKNHSKATVTKTGSAGQRGRELAFCRMWQYLG